MVDPVEGIKEATFYELFLGLLRQPLFQHLGHYEYVECSSSVCKALLYTSRIIRLLFPISHTNIILTMQHDGT